MLTISRFRCKTIDPAFQRGGCSRVLVGDTTNGGRGDNLGQTGKGGMSSLVTNLKLRGRGESLTTAQKSGRIVSCRASGEGGTTHWFY